MIIKKGYKRVPLSFNRRAVIASASVTKDKNAIHCFTEVDITVPRDFIKKYFEKTGEKLSLTAYIVICFSNVIKYYPRFNSFIKDRKLILLDDITISVLIEREIAGGADKFLQFLVSELQPYIDSNFKTTVSNALGI